jgi:hypothetical protein
MIGSLPSSTAISYFDLAAAKLTLSGGGNQNQAYRTKRPPNPFRLTERGAMIFLSIPPRRWR